MNCQTLFNDNSDQCATCYSGRWKNKSKRIPSAFLLYFGLIQKVSFLFRHRKEWSENLMYPSTRKKHHLNTIGM